MPIPTYTPGYPPDNSSLGQTKATIRNNLDGTFETLGIDHINNNGDPGAKPAGYHNVIHSVPQGSDPAAVTGYGQLYSKTINSFTTDQALFWETGAGLIQQLTSNFTPLIGSVGKTFLPGGLILQWNSNVFSSGSNSTTFVALGAVAFPNNCFGIIANLAETSGSANNLNISSLTASSFTYNNTSSSNRRFFWIAIGN